MVLIAISRNNVSLLQHWQMKSCRNLFVLQNLLCIKVFCFEWIFWCKVSFAWGRNLDRMQFNNFAESLYLRQIEMCSVGVYELTVHHFAYRTFLKTLSPTVDCVKRCLHRGTHILRSYYQRLDTVKLYLSTPRLKGNLSWRRKKIILNWLNFSYFFVRKFRL